MREPERGYILVVDDDPVMQRTIASILEDAGHVVQCAAHGRAALALLEQEVRPALVVLDIPMPQMDGCAFGEQLTLRATDQSKGIWVYQAPAAIGQAGCRREQCTDGKTGRRLVRPFDQEYRARARALPTTAADQQAPGKRAVGVERWFGEANAWHGLARFGEVGCSR